MFETDSTAHHFLFLRKMNLNTEQARDHNKFQFFLCDFIIYTRKEKEKREESRVKLNEWKIYQMTL